ncbi:RE1-silencing transcription factor isoform X2 [Octodon degus]|uniref:RE1-silencing transcription factor n=1 Tax=Octodon degus TaxID=10160 RepID=A0A6P6E381_OCTDE|nr:RE1-silencing transcription factor isoform X2 [Octodon degus]
MATQVMGQASGGAGLFPTSGNMGMALPNDMYDLHDLSKAELAAPQLIMLANVALTGEVNGSCCDYLVGEERQMAELMPVGDNNFSDSDGEGLEDSSEVKGESNGLENMELRNLELSVVEPQPVFEASAAPEIYSSNKDNPPETPGAEDKCKNLKTKPFRCKPCQYEAESEEQFVHHIRVHSAKKFFVEESAEKQAKARESSSSGAEEGDFSKGPIRCDRCGYNTNRYDHYTAHLKHHTRAGDNERVYKCIICTYTTVSEYHWRKHLRNHFPRKVYTCSKCNYFSDRKNNYVQHVRTHTGERPYKCELCPYSSSQKTHLTRHMRTHSGEKPFKCDQCSYVASNQHEVTRHARQVHNGPKPLNCPHCDYKTADRSNFKKHVELHVNPRQFNCPVCDYAASKKCNLQYHFKSKHPTCPNKTMDVSKVKLKKTKKREVDLAHNSITNEKTEQTKTKGDVAGKKNEKSIKVEKKDVSKEKKPCSTVSASQVTTRTRKSATETKEVDVHTGNSSEKPCKSKKSKRKLETEVQSLCDPVSEEGPVTKKKKKTGNKSKNGQEVSKGNSKVGENKEENKKQNAYVKKSTRKKALKSKSSKKSSKPALKEPPQKGAALRGPVRIDPPVEPVPPAPGQAAEELPPADGELPPADGELPPADGELPPADGEPAPLGEAGQAQVEPHMAGEVPTPMEGIEEGSLPLEPAPKEGVQEPPPSPEPAQKGSAEVELPPPAQPALHMEPSPKKSPRKESKRERSNVQSEMACKEQVLIEVGLVPVKDSQLLKESTDVQDLSTSGSPASPLPEEEGSEDQSSLPAGPGDTEGSLQKEGVEVEGRAAPKEAASVSASVSRPSTQEGQTSDEVYEHQTPSDEPCEMEVVTDESTAENLPAQEAAVEETASLSLFSPPLEEQETESKTAPAPAPVSATLNESQEIDEDEGIHSHDGSDLSDNMSEGSDDSGLHGARQVPQETATKNTKEILAAKVAEGDFVCIFCDRSFRKEKDYSKHLNRHLVNVYFLEKATQGQE